MRKAFIGFIVSCGIFILALLGAVTARSRGPGDAAPAKPGGPGEPALATGIPGTGTRLAARGDRPVTVGILVFDGVQIIDFSGPWEVFGEAGYRVFTISEGGGPVTTTYQEKILPDYSITNAPEADILVIPGGHVRHILDDPSLIRWVQQRPGSVLSVCTGAFVLARAGLLDGLRATTYHGSLDDLAREAPKTTVVSDERYVDNGRIIVAAGLSSGIDGALHLVEEIDGRGAAEAAALNMEYDWNRRGTYVRAALADRYIDFVREAMPGPYVQREGDRDRWSDSWLLPGIASTDVAMRAVNRVLSAEKRWTRLDSDAPSATGPSHWGFKDENGGDWRCVAQVEGTDAGVVARVAIECLDKKS